ncbi:excisionase family DNA-binding protein [Phaeobacter inhibens]|uniref:excisionase family DNA-binding protein n=1 Tax=Phaeobacter inhibens TaxID=221822 RepID=UPI0022077CB2|nr:excisionase family DNA-binding protein [Phaeobacter inhibens]
MGNERSDIWRLSTKETAERMSLSVRRVRQLIADRELRYVKIRNRCLVPEGAIDEFFKANTVSPLFKDPGTPPSEDR